MRDAEYRHAVEEAARLGAEIEMSVLGIWVRCPIRCGITFAWESCDYRVKPPETEPLRARAWWVKESTLLANKCYVVPHVPCEPDEFRRAGFIHIREVMPEPTPHPLLDRTSFNALRAYLLDAVTREDWHAVRDAAVDIELLQARGVT